MPYHHLRVTIYRCHEYVYCSLEDVMTIWSDREGAMTDLSPLGLINFITHGPPTSQQPRRSTVLMWQAYLTETKRPHSQCMPEKSNLDDAHDRSSRKTLLNMISRFRRDERSHYERAMRRRFPCTRVCCQHTTQVL